MTLDDYICRVLSEIISDRYGVRVNLESCHKKEETAAGTTAKQGQGAAA